MLRGFVSIAHVCLIHVKNKQLYLRSGAVVKVVIIEFIKKMKVVISEQWSRCSHLSVYF